METFVTKDISIAAFLLSTEEVRLIKNEKTSHNIVFFHFSPKNRAEELVTLYWSDSVKVSPRKIMSSFRSLKDLIFGN